MTWHSDHMRMDRLHRGLSDPDRTTIRSRAITEEEKVHRDAKTSRLRDKRLSLRGSNQTVSIVNRTTETEICFYNPFVIGTLFTPLAAGTYRLSVDEERIEELSFSAYRTTAAHLEIPSIETPSLRRQQLQVTPAEIYAALLKDKKTAR